MSELVASFKLADGREARKFRSDDGNVTYRVDGNFISPDVYEGLEESPKAEYIVTPRSSEDRAQALRNRYEGFEDYEGLDVGNVSARESGLRQSAKGWKANETLRKQVANDPLIRSRREENKALEARAKEIARALDGVEGKQRIRILKSYDVY